MPDIDIDFCFERRGEVIDYVSKKYGQDHVAQIVTFGTMAARGVLRDVGRVKQIPLSEVDRLAKMVPFAPDMTLDKALEVSKELKARYDKDEVVKDWIDTAKQLEGLFIVPEVARHNAPGFRIENLEGGVTSLHEYRGKLVLLNFWATWCIPCRQEMPGMEVLWKKYRERGFVVIAVSNDDGPKERVGTFSRLLDISYPVLLDPDGKVSGHYGVSGMPTSFLVDRNGKIISRIVGEKEWSSPEAFRLVEKLLSL